MILLWGVREDGPLALVDEELRARGVATTFLDQRHALTTRFLSGPGAPSVRLRDGTVALGDVSAVYARPYPLLPSKLRDGCAAQTAGIRHVQRLEQSLWQWMTAVHGVVVNRPSPGATNSTKPWQTQTAAVCGFDVPVSLVTNDRDRALEFHSDHRCTVYKAAGGTRTYAAFFDPTDTDRLERLSTCPTYFQEYIAGTNVRVHVVGTRVFAVAISTDELDYRRDVGTMTPTVLPGSVAQRCLLVSEALGLQLSGIDLIHTRDDRWYFLEANTSPAFSFYPDRAAVGAAIVDLLRGA